MSWSLSWSIVAERDLLAIHWLLAARVDAAVMRFAASGQGNVRRIEPLDPKRLCLYVDGAEARLFLDPNERVLYVSRVFARRAAPPR
ncbi:MAG: hypothetical protein U0359_26205 [Byssovorax sp.]